MPRLIKSITAALVKKGGKKVARFFEKKTLRLTVNNALVKLYLVREDLVLQTLVTIAVWGIHKLCRQDFAYFCPPPLPIRSQVY